MPAGRQRRRNSFLAWNRARVFLPLCSLRGRQRPEEESREGQDSGKITGPSFVDVKPGETRRAICRAEVHDAHDGVRASASEEAPPPSCVITAEIILPVFSFKPRHDTSRWHFSHSSAATPRAMGIHRTTGRQRLCFFALGSALRALVDVCRKYRPEARKGSHRMGLALGPTRWARAGRTYFFWVPA